MGNPLMGMMNKTSNMGGMMGINNPILMMQQFRKFCKEMKGINADAHIKELVKSGKVTQEQADQALEMAKQMQGMFK